MSPVQDQQQQDPRLPQQSRGDLGSFARIGNRQSILPGSANARPPTPPLTNGDVSQGSGRTAFTDRRPRRRPAMPRQSWRHSHLIGNTFQDHHAIHAGWSFKLRNRTVLIRKEIDRKTGHESKPTPDKKQRPTLATTPWLTLTSVTLALAAKIPNKQFSPVGIRAFASRSRRMTATLAAISVGAGVLSVAGVPAVHAGTISSHRAVSLAAKTAPDPVQNIFAAPSSGTFAQRTLELQQFGHDQAWRVNRHVRLVVDMNNNGRPDIVGFGDTGVWISYGLSDGKFTSRVKVHSFFGANANSGGFASSDQPRFVADINGDGRRDLIGIRNDGVYRSLARPDGTYGPVQRVLQQFGVDQGWHANEHRRQVVDLNRDGRSDIVGFGTMGTYVSYGRSDGNFTPRVMLSSFFGSHPSAGGFAGRDYPRFVADINGDGRRDLIGIRSNGVYRSLARPDGSYASPVWVLQQFGLNQGWHADLHVRLVTDVTADGKADIVGFGYAGTWVARAQ
jgi:hypothetical protein